MHSPDKYDLQAARRGGNDSELEILRDIFRMLPHGVTVQDEHGRLLLANDAAATQLRIDAMGPSSSAMDHRRARPHGAV
jgi:PAS domain-containing protein